MSRVKPPEQAGIVPLWLTYSQAQRMSGLGRTKLSALVNSGQIKAARVGRAVRINRQSLEDFMETRATQALRLR
jgi:excisionase family DNA binding protein